MASSDQSIVIFSGGSKPAPGSSQALVLRPNAAPDPAAEAEKRIADALELEKKLKMINELVPDKVTNVCSSSAGAGSGDFHQYRMIRRNEQQRVARLEEEYKKKQEEEEFDERKREREKLAEEQTARRRAKRQKKNEKKKLKGKKDGGAGKEGGQEGQPEENKHQSSEGEELD